MLTIPGGREQGTAIDQASDKTLEYWAKNARGVDIQTACSTEIARRAAGGKPAERAEAPAPQPVDNRAIQAYCGAHDDAQKATSVLAKLQSIGHLVSPAPACGSLPEGTAMVISSVMVDVENETFAIAGGDKLGIGKVPTYKIASALGVSWDRSSGRQDDGSDARFVHFMASGWVRQFDGCLMFLTGEKVMDLRPGSPQIEALKEQAETKYARAMAKWEKNGHQGYKPEPGNWENQVRDMRLRILEHAETKAKLRAIRSLGIRQSYTREELLKPFFAAKLQFTGYSDDPEIRRMFAERIADSMLGSVSQLYGAQQAPVAHAAPKYQPPPVRNTTGSTLDDEDGEPVDDDEFPH